MKIKGFDKNLCCRGMQFEVGKVYDTGAKDDEIYLYSDTVFHYCDDIKKVHEYYCCNPEIENRFCEIEVLGAEVSDCEKFGSNRIKIVREIVGDELSILTGMTNGNSGLFNTGYDNKGSHNTGSFNSGHYNSGNHNTGICNTGDYNTSHYNSGNWNSGYRNSGSCNSGNKNSGFSNGGNSNSGFYNMGDDNSGNCNNGHFNSGNCNSGDFNSGSWNSCCFSNGFFCNIDDKNIRIFNKTSGMSMTDFLNSKYYNALNSTTFSLTWWDEENHCLKSRSYKEACAIWWENMKPENKEIIKNIPNFDPEVFFDITGIDLRNK